MTASTTTRTSSHDDDDDADDDDDDDDDDDALAHIALTRVRAVYSHTQHVFAAQLY